TLYNDAYRPILGTRKHPRALGRPGRECWVDIWNVIGPMLEGALWRGEATLTDDPLLPPDRHRYRAECCFALPLLPVRQHAGPAARSRRPRAAAPPGLSRRSRARAVACR